jgi:hypothetical protein
MSSGVPHKTAAREEAVLVPFRHRELDLTAKRQGPVTRPSYDADPPLSGLTMVARVMQTAKEPRADAGRF